jgi:VIT1/CCC1 family predicted Fe2+/Mn2+ transporter
MPAAFPEAEQAELQNTLSRYGVDDDTAGRMAAEVSRDPESALRLHTREELGVEHQALPSAVVAGVASRPVVHRPADPAGALPGLNSLVVAVALTAVALVAGGLLLGRITGRPLMRSAARQLLLGAIAVAVTFAVGRLSAEVCSAASAHGGPLRDGCPARRKTLWDNEKVRPPVVHPRRLSSVLT